MFPALLFVLAYGLNAQQKDIKLPPEATEVWEPQPRIVTSGKTMNTPPSDAIVLFDGKNTDAWSKLNGDAIEWTIEGDALVVKPGSGDIMTRRKFSDFQLHIEFRTPAVVDGEGQGRGNSGVFLQRRYEVQVLDNYENKTYSNGQAGSLYKQTPPLVNASRQPGTWQTYDIIYTAPVFNKDGLKTRSAYVTVLHNGVIVQHHTEIKGTTEYIGWPKNIAHGPDGIQLQDHGNLTAFKNIWIREM
ncbi:hypothetical protein CEQ90_17540 [Lewinellaceae bacterium SD302]|nr:hypothetical protein CEQ90_17540 [Lewinellaceae bacterium SD302]